MTIITPVLACPSSRRHLLETFGVYRWQCIEPDLEVTPLDRPGSRLDAPRASAAPSRTLPAQRSRLDRTVDGKHETDNRSPIRVVSGVDLPTVAFDDLADDRQTES